MFACFMFYAVYFVYDFYTKMTCKEANDGVSMQTVRINRLNLKSKK